MIKKFQFYTRYLWSAADFTNLQKWLRDHASKLVSRLSGDLSKGHVISGFDFVSTTAMNVTVGNGAAVSANGSLMETINSTTVTFPVPPSQLQAHLLVVRPLLTQTDLITDPTNPLAQVYLTEEQGTQLVVISAAAGPNPVYPSTLADDVVLFGLVTASTDTFIFENSIDYAPRSVVNSTRETFGTHTQVATKSFRVMRNEVFTRFWFKAKSSESYFVHGSFVTSQKDTTGASFTSTGGNVHSIF
jgi:hypothetical protein